MKNFIITFAAIATVVAMSSCTVEDQILPVSENDDVYSYTEDGLQTVFEESIDGTIDQQEASAIKNEALNDLEIADAGENTGNGAGNAAKEADAQDETAIKGRPQNDLRISEEENASFTSFRFAPQANKKATE